MSRAPDSFPAGVVYRWWKPLALTGVVVALFILARALGMGDRLMGLREWIVSLGPWAPVVYVMVYAGATVAMLPGSAITVTAADALVKGMAEGRVPWGLLAAFGVASGILLLLAASARKRLGKVG